MRALLQHPEKKGAVHAWIGVVMGALFTVKWGSVLIGIGFAMFAP